MLFDLRGRGRRRAVRVIYLGLALLMGGGLVLFGIGSSQSGGLFDAISGGSGSTSATAAIDKRINGAVVLTRKRPTDPGPWATLAALRFQRANVAERTTAGTFTDKGLQGLRSAGAAWERHLALDPKQPNVRAARIMVQAYGAQGLNDLPKAVTALQIVTGAENPPNPQLFAQLAQLAYQAKDTRTGDLAADRAVALTDKSKRKQLKDALAQLKLAAAQPATTQTTASPTG
jgi:hypothetical protein